MDFRIALDIDIGNTTPDYRNLFKDLFKETAPKIIPIIEHYQSKQTDKKEVYSYVKEWMVGRRELISKPSTVKDFISLAETAYWYGYLGIKTSIFDNVEKSLDDKFKQLDLQTMSELTFGFSILGNENLLSVLKRHEEIIFQVFSSSFGILCLEDSKDVIKIDYILEISDDDNHFLTSEKENNDTKSMVIIGILQKLCPNKQYYSTQGHGIKMISDLANIPEAYQNDTFKKIPKKNLPSPYLVQLNSTFIAYLQYRYRPLTWEVYLNQILSIRKMIIDIFQSLVQGVKRYYKRKDFSVIVNNETYPILINSINKLQNIPLFPMSAVDIWGFSSEEISSSIDKAMNASDKNQKKIEGKIATLERYYNFRKSIQNLSSSCSNFLNQITELLVNRIKGMPNVNYLSLHNIMDAYNRLKIFQKEFRNLFFPLYSEPEPLDQIENKETKLYSLLFSSWFFFCFKPNKKITNTTDFCDKYVRIHFKNKVVESLKVNLRNYDIIYKIQDGYWEDNNALWIIGDFLEIPELTEDNNFDITLHLSGDFFENAWKDCLKQFDSQQLIYLVQYHWQDICLVFTYKNKLIFKSIKKKGILSSILDNDSHYFDFPYEDTFNFQKINIEGFWQTDQTEKIQRLFESFINLRLVLNHSVELLTVLEGNDSMVNEQLVKSYFTSQLEKSGIFFQSFLEALFEVHQIIEDRLSEDNICVAVYSEIIAQYKTFYPDPDQEINGSFDCVVSTDSLPDWMKRIDENQELIYSFYILMFFNALLEEEL